MMKNKLFTNWNVVRWVRLLFGLGAVITGFLQKENLAIIAGVFLVITALSNTGCCGANGCTPQINNKKEKSKEVVYEEVGP